MARNHPLRPCRSLKRRTSSVAAIGGDAAAYDFSVERSASHAQAALAVKIRSPEMMSLTLRRALAFSSGIDM